MKLGSLNSTLPKIPKQKLLTIPGVHGVKKIERHKDYNGQKLYNDLAILTLAKPITFDNETTKGELQTNKPKSKV